jgi:transcriptional regulator with XRE-family HTH domain
MNQFAQNLKALREESLLKQTEIAEKLGITASTLSNYEVGKSQPNIETLVKIANYYGVSVDGLVKRDVSLIAKNLNRVKRQNESPNESLKESLMLHEQEMEQMRKEHAMIGQVPKVVTIDSQGRDNILFVPSRARAGYLTGYEDPEFIQTLPTYRMPGLSHGTFRMFEVYGTSMVPTFNESDIIIGRFVENFNEIRDDRCYVVVSKRDGVVVKRVINRIHRDGKLILNSDNQRHVGEFPPIVLDPEEVLEIWYATAFMSRQMRAPGEVYNRLIDVESRLTLLEHDRKKIGK